jgi:type VI secretion system secreted protein VgrG
MGTTVEHDDTQTVHNNRTITVDGTHTETIKKDTSITVSEGTYTHDVAANTASYHVRGALTENYDDTQTTNVFKNRTLTVNQNISESALLKITITAGVELNLVGPGGSIKIDSTGVTIQGVLVKIN